MSPQECIAALDQALALDGEWVTLRRVVGSAPNQANIDVRCRAKVTGVTTEQIIGNVAATELNVILSPTQINDAQWPGGTVPALPPLNVDQRVPRVNGDKMIARGAVRNVTYSDPQFVAGELVRINMRIG